jgi:hypothetical protein
MTEKWDHDDPMSEISMLSTKQDIPIIILNSVFVTLISDISKTVKNSTKPAGHFLLGFGMPKSH